MKSEKLIKDFKDKVSSDTSGNAKKLLVSLLQFKRSENSTPNDD